MLILFTLFGLMYSKSDTRNFTLCQYVAFIVLYVVVLMLISFAFFQYYRPFNSETGITILNICLNVLGMILIRFGCSSIETAIFSVIGAVIIKFYQNRV